MHNSQPWRFRITADGIELHADPERRLRVADPSGRELRLACGAALFNLRLALTGQGVRPLVTVLPNPLEPELIAVVRRGGGRPPTPTERRLLAAVPHRRTNRRPFTTTPVGNPARHALRRAALDEGAWLDLVTDAGHRASLSLLARRAHERQIADPAFVAELDRWTARELGRPDGVPLSAAGPVPSPNAAWIMRDFSASTGPDRGYEADPLIAVLVCTATGRTRRSVQARPWNASC